MDKNKNSNNIVTFIEDFFGEKFDKRLIKTLKKLSQKEVIEFFEDWAFFEFNLDVFEQFDMPYIRRTVLSNTNERQQPDIDSLKPICKDNLSDLSKDIANNPQNDLIKTIIAYSIKENLAYIRKLMLVYDKIIIPYVGWNSIELLAFYKVNGEFISSLFERLLILKPLISEGIIVLFPLNNPKAESAARTIPNEAWAYLGSIEEDFSHYWGNLKSFYHPYYFEGINFSDLCCANISTNHFNSFYIYSDMMNFIQKSFFNNNYFQSIDSFSLIIDGICMPQLEKLSVEDQISFKDQEHAYTKFRENVEKLTSKIQNYRNHGSEEKFKKFVHDYANDIFIPGIRELRPKSVPEIAKDTFVKFYLAFMGFETIEDYLTSSEDVVDTILKLSVPTSFVLIYEIAKSLSQKRENRLALAHNSLFVDTQSDKLSHSIKKYDYRLKPLETGQIRADFNFAVNEEGKPYLNPVIEELLKGLNIGPLYR